MKNSMRSQREKKLAREGRGVWGAAFFPRQNEIRCVRCVRVCVFFCGRVSNTVKIVESGSQA